MKNRPKVDRFWYWEEEETWPRAPSSFRASRKYVNFLSLLKLQCLEKIFRKTVQSFWILNLFRLLKSFKCIVAYNRKWCIRSSRNVKNLQLKNWKIHQNLRPIDLEDFFLHESHVGTVKVISIWRNNIYVFTLLITNLTAGVVLNF